MIKNLGQVAAIYIGTVAPTNRNMIWLDNTVIPYVFRSYDGASWSELATRDWVKMFVNGWLVSLAPTTETQKTDYLLINSGNVNYKIAVKDFVASAIGNPLDFKGVIKTSADFPNPSTLEPGDMYVIITTPPGGTVTDPYSGKTFEDSEKIVWDGVTIGWESLGKIKITVDLSTEYTANKVTINSTAGEGTDINAASETSAGVMNALMYVLLDKLSNGSIIPAEQPSDKSTPAHRHNYADIIGRVISQQEEGDSTFHPMSQDATTKALALKFDKASVLQVLGNAADKVISQKVVTDNLALKADITWVQTNYLPLTAGPTKPLSGILYTPAGINIANDVGLRFGTDASNSGYRAGINSSDGSLIIGKDWDSIMIGTSGKVTRFLSNITVPYLNWSLLGTDGKAILSTGATPGDITLGTGNADLYLKNANADLQHNKAGTNYKIWDASNLPNPATLTDLAKYIPLTGGKNIGPLWLKDGSSTLTEGGIYDAAGNALLAYTGTDNYFGTSLGSTYIRSIANDLIHRRGNVNYKIWDSYNLASPATTTDLGNYLPLAGGTMSGSIVLINNKALLGNPTTGGNYNLVKIDQLNNVDVGDSLLTLRLYSNATNLKHIRGEVVYEIWDSFNLRDPLPRSAGAGNALTGNLYTPDTWGLCDPNGNNIVAIDSTVNQYFGRTFGTTYIRSGNSDLYHIKGSNQYKIWDASNLPNPATLTDLAKYIPLTGGKNIGPLWLKDGSSTLTEGGIYDAAGNALLAYTGTDNYFGTSLGSTYIRSIANDLIHRRGNVNYKIWDSYNLASPATTTDLGNYLPLAGGTMSGSIVLINNKALLGNPTTGGNYNLVKIDQLNNVDVGDSLLTLRLYSNATNLKHIRGEVVYEIWDSFNLRDPLPRSAGAGNALTGNLYTPDTWGLCDPNGNNIVAIDSTVNQYFGRTFGTTYIRSGNSDLYHIKGSNQYKIWDASNLPNVEYTWGFNGVIISTEIDLNTALNNGSSKPKAVYNYSSLALWKNAPTGMGYGSVFELWNSAIGNDNDNGYGSLTPQLAFDVNHNVAASTRYMYFRVANNLGYGDSSNWKRVVTADEIGTITGNYLPLSGGIMTGTIYLNNNVSLAGSNTSGGNHNLIRVNDKNSIIIGSSSLPVYMYSNENDIYHYRNSTQYRLWDSYNLSQPATLNTAQTFTGIKTFNSRVVLNNDIAIVGLLADGSDFRNLLWISTSNNPCFGSASSQPVIVSSATDIIHRRANTNYNIWDTYNLSNPATTTDLNSYLPLTAGSTKPLTSTLYFNSVNGSEILYNLTGITEGWERGLVFQNNGVIAKIGVFGHQTAPDYAYISATGTYNDIKNLRVYPSGSIQIGGVSNALLGYSNGSARISDLNLTKKANDVLYISSFIEGGSNYPGSDSISGQAINDGYALTYFWLSDVALQIAFDVDGTGVAYRSYKPSTGTSTTVWKFLADTAWVNTKINSTVGNYLPLSGGVITSTAATPLTINGTSSGGSEVGLLINRSGVKKAFFGYNSNLGAFMYSYARSKYLYISDTADEVRLGTSGSDYALAKAVGIGTVGNNFIWNQNEFSFVPAGYNNRVWFNYRAIDGSALTNPIQEYCFGAGTQGGYTRVVASGFKTPTGTNQNILRGDGSSSPLSEATTTTAGLMSSSDKTKVNDAIVSTGTNKVIGILVVDEIPSPSDQTEGVLYLKFE